MSEVEMAKKKYFIQKSLNNVAYATQHNHLVWIYSTEKKNNFCIDWFACTNGHFKSQPTNLSSKESKLNKP